MHARFGLYCNNAFHQCLSTGPSTAKPSLLVWKEKANRTPGAEELSMKLSPIDGISAQHHKPLTLPDTPSSTSREATDCVIHPRTAFRMPDSKSSSTTLLLNQ